ncbi:hypothetical protein DPMN_105053 [Dreissena polymorpha]|uniref:Uncharacterized protein n=1 Tax=Dreissena polymorpha TaxID=45954 RepID=A0A9D4K370_DREPO|nr:hypothetical protein DPMN_105053 [Dreissena polymorpha]
MAHYQTPKSKPLQPVCETTPMYSVRVNQRATWVSSVTNKQMELREGNYGRGTTGGELREGQSLYASQHH